MKKRLTRDIKNKMIAGVCSGIANYFNIDPTLVRLLWVVLTLISFGLGGIVAYIIAWIIIPER
jgi:phage shock protein C